jgi:hypothetical protein
MEGLAAVKRKCAVRLWDLEAETRLRGLDTWPNVETHKGWPEEHRCLIMDLHVEHKWELLRQLEGRVMEISPLQTSSYRG